MSNNIYQQLYSFIVLTYTLTKLYHIIYMKLSDKGAANYDRFGTNDSKNYGL